MGYFSQPSDLEWFNALLQFSTSIGEINTELLHKQRTLSLLRKQFTSLFGLNKEVCWQLIGSSDVNRWADWLTGSHVISHVFGLVGEYLSAFNQSASRRRTPYCRSNVYYFQTTKWTGRQCPMVWLDSMMAQLFEGSFKKQAKFLN